MLPEEALVSAIAAAVGGPSGNVVLGIGDDAAVLDDGTVVSTDILVEGVHFDLGRTTPREVGHRAATANLSDLAAMGARPVALLAAFGLPGGLRRRRPRSRPGCSEHGVPVAGGDLSRAPVLIVSVTALGRSERPVRRSGGRPGRRARRDRAAGRPGRRRLHRPRAAPDRRGMCAGGRRDRDDRPLRRHRHRRRPAGAGVRHRRDHRARAAAARRRGDDRAGGDRRRGLRAPGGASARRRASGAGHGRRPAHRRRGRRPARCDGRAAVSLSGWDHFA